MRQIYLSHTHHRRRFLPHLHNILHCCKWTAIPHILSQERSPPRRQRPEEVKESASATVIIVMDH